MSQAMCPAPHGRGGGPPNLLRTAARVPVLPRIRPGRGRPAGPDRGGRFPAGRGRGVRGRSGTCSGVPCRPVALLRDRGRSPFRSRPAGRPDGRPSVGGSAGAGLGGGGEKRDRPRSRGAGPVLGSALRGRLRSAAAGACASGRQERDQRDGDDRGPEHEARQVDGAAPGAGLAFSAGPDVHTRCDARRTRPVRPARTGLPGTPPAPVRRPVPAPRRAAPGAP